MRKHDFTVLTCTKVYPEIPFAHRQYTHDGHCKHIHGHNWTIILTLGAKAVDKNSFIADFGDLKPLKLWIDENLDHAFVICQADPEKKLFEHMEKLGLVKLYQIPNSSSEGLASYLSVEFSDILHLKFAGRVVLLSVEIKEDSKNSAKFINPQYCGDNTVLID